MGRLDEGEPSDSHPGDVCVSVLRCVVEWCPSISVDGIDIRFTGQKSLRAKHRSSNSKRDFLIIDHLDFLNVFVVSCLVKWCPFIGWGVLEVCRVVDRSLRKEAPISNFVRAVATVPQRSIWQRRAKR